MTPRVFQTSIDGDALRALPDAESNAQTAGAGAPVTLEVDAGAERQEIVGFGSSFTESAARVLEQLPAARRDEVLAACFGHDGAAYSLTRTHIGSCDFSPEGRWGHAVRPDLSDFSLGVAERELLPMIDDAARISRDTGAGGFRIIASPWSCPPFMKRGETKGDGWFGGELDPTHHGAFADYIARWISACRDRGIDIWGITPVNEPHGNGMNWESLHMDGEAQRAFIVEALGPVLQRRSPETKILVFDQNREEAEAFVQPIYADPACAAFVDGIALHWYGSTFDVYEEVLDRLHARYPDTLVLNSEACTDMIWDDAEEWDPPAPMAQQAYHQPDVIRYWKNWRWWWEVRATDWGFVFADKRRHPRYAATDRLINDIVGGLRHWMNGWVDWNLCLDWRGGPNHVHNYCGAPIMARPETGEVFYTPLYFVLAHFSRFLHPGGRVLETRIGDTHGGDGLSAVAARNPGGGLAVVVTNISAHPDGWESVRERNYELRVGKEVFRGRIPAHALQTLVFPP